MHPTIYYLQHKNLLWQANNGHPGDHNEQLTGFKELDNALQGGFPSFGVVDIRSPIGIGELRLILPSMLTRQHQRPAELIAFIAPPLSINSEMLAEFGFTLEQVMMIQPTSIQHSLWSAEQSLKSGCCHSVIIWQQSLSVTHIRRLQLAAEKGNCLLFVMRSPHQEHISLPVALGIKLSPDKQGIKVKIIKRKGGWPSHNFTINMNHYWPELSQPIHSNILTFPSRTHQAG
jgi:cell division inhibitor SulA